MLIWQSNQQYYSLTKVSNRIYNHPNHKSSRLVVDYENFITSESVLLKHNIHSDHKTAA